MKFTKPFAIAALSVAALFTTFGARADVVPQTISSEAKSGATRANGARQSRTSEPTTVRAPVDYVINKDATLRNVKILAEYGSEHTYSLVFGDEVEIIKGTGIFQPTSVTLVTHSRSERGAGGGGGQMKLTVDVVFTKYRNLPEAG